MRQLLVGVSIAAGILFGLAPALKAARTDVSEALKAGGRGIASARSFVRNTFVVADVALSMIQLVGAGLLIRSFVRRAGADRRQRYHRVTRCARRPSYSRSPKTNIPCPAATATYCLPSTE
jgi:hypothetical protein